MEQKKKTERAMVVVADGQRFYSPRVVIEDIGNGRYSITPVVPWARGPM